MLEIKEDIRDECSKLGEITNVVLFDREPDGVASVRFANPEAAKACVRVRLTPLPLYMSPCYLNIDTNESTVDEWPLV